VIRSETAPLTFITVVQTVQRMSEESVWSGLGSNVLGGNRIDELKTLVEEIHRELMGSVEALARRVGSLESSLSDFDSKMNLLIKAVDRLESLPVSAGAGQHSDEPIDNVLMVMSAAELGIERTPEELEPVEDDVEVLSIKGFVAPPPIGEKTPPTDADECADAIIGYLKKNDGIRTNHWKTRGLIDKSVDSKTRKEIKGILADKGAKFHKVNKFADWVFLGDEDPAEHFAKHNA